MESAARQNTQEQIVPSLAKKQRIPAIDVAKGIGILLVVFTHVNYTPVILTFVYSFHMPLFFILSGMLFNRQKYISFRQFLKQRFFTLICPYICFYIAIVIFRFVIDLVLDGYSPQMLESYGHFLVQMLIAEKSATVISAPLWFVPCLFAVELIYFGLSKLKKPLTIAVCTVLVCTGWLINSEYVMLHNMIIPWNLGTGLFVLGFYALGNLSSEMVRLVIAKVDGNKYRTVICIAGLLVCLAVLVPFAYLNGKISVGSRELNNGFLTYLTGILGTAAVLFISILLSKNRFLRFCGQNSFCIMASHHQIRRVLESVYIFVGLGLYDYTKISETIIPLIIVFTATLLFTWLYSKAARKLKKIS